MGHAEKWPQPHGPRRVFSTTLSSKNLLLTLLSLVAAGATALAWRQRLELMALRTDGERSMLEARLADFKKRNFELQTELAAMHAGKAAGESAADAVASGDGAAVSPGAAAILKQAADVAAEAGGLSKRDEDLELLAALADLPEFQKMLALQERGKVDEKYAALFKKLKLSPDELARLQTLLADRQGAFADAMMAAGAQGLTGKEARQVANEVAKASQKDITASIKDLLGPQRFNQFQSYERTQPQREMVDQLAQRLSYTSTPLTPRQQDQLVTVLATAAAPPKTNPAGAPKAKPAAPIPALPGALSGMGIGSGAQAPIVDAAVGKAQAFLSPRQIAALQQLQQEQNAQQTLGNLLRTGTVNAPPKPAKPKG